MAEPSSQPRWEQPGRGEKKKAEKYFPGGSDPGVVKWNGFSPCFLFKVFMGCLDPTAELALQQAPLWAGVKEKTWH